MSKNNNKFFARGLICCMIYLLLFIFQGCAPHLSENYGKSYETVLYTQAINPDGPKDMSPVDSYPGVIAEGIYEKYLTTFGSKSFAEQLGEMLMKRD